jgi:hypothetical protein
MPVKEGKPSTSYCHRGIKLRIANRGPTLQACGDTQITSRTFYPMGKLRRAGLRDELGCNYLGTEYRFGLEPWS